MPEDTTVQTGLDIIEDWLRDQFPDADMEPLGRKSDVRRNRWIVHHGTGKAAFWLAATVDAVGSPPRLLRQLYELESGTWLKDIDENEQSPLITETGITNLPPGEW